MEDAQVISKIFVSSKTTVKYIRHKETARFN